MRKYDIILLDADDTLFDFVQSEENAIRETFDLYGIPNTTENLRRYQEINEDLWRQFERAEITKSYLLDNRFSLFFSAIGKTGNGVKANSDYLDRLACQHILLPGALTLCENLKALGCRLYLATNGVTRVQKKRLADSELNGIIDGIFVSEEAGAQKPQKEYFDYVLSRLKDPDRSRVLMVGDSLSSDIKGAVDYGLDSCWLNRKGASTDLPITAEVHSIPEILRVVER